MATLTISSMPRKSWLSKGESRAHPDGIAFEELLDRMRGDVETFFLSPQGHHHWRGGQAYSVFPFPQSRVAPNRRAVGGSLTLSSRLLVSVIQRPSGWSRTSL